MIINTIIQARTGSTRLPGKINEKIGDKTLLQMVYERCAMAKLPQKTILALHGQYIDMSWAEDVIIVQGPEEPAARFLKVLAEHPCDGFVRVCADSPFIDFRDIDEAAKRFSISDFDYWRLGRKAGNRVEIFSSRGFVLAEQTMTGSEREHLGLFFHNRDRLCVDTPADLERARLIVSRMTKPHTEYTAAECLGLLRK